MPNDQYGVGRCTEGRWDRWGNFHFNLPCLRRLTITSSHKPKGQRCVLLTSAAPHTPHTVVCWMPLSSFHPSRVLTVNQCVGLASQLPGGSGLPSSLIQIFQGFLLQTPSLSPVNLTPCPLEMWQENTLFWILIPFLIYFPFTCFTQRIEGQRPGCWQNRLL